MYGGVRSMARRPLRREVAANGFWNSNTRRLLRGVSCCERLPFLVYKVFPRIKHIRTHFPFNVQMFSLTHIALVKIFVFR